MSTDPASRIGLEAILKALRSHIAETTSETVGAPVVQIKRSELVEWERLLSTIAAVECSEPMDPSGELTSSFAKSYPGGQLDETTFSEIETALDIARAPLTDGDRWLTLPERVDALVRLGSDVDRLVEDAVQEIRSGANAALIIRGVIQAAVAASRPA